MSILFKQNSRFAALAEEDTQSKKVKKDFKQQNNDMKSKNDETNINSFRGRGSEDRFRCYEGIENQKSKEERLLEEKNRKLREKLEKERLEQESLKQSNFPSLDNKVKNTENTEVNNISYLDKIKQNNININKSLDNDILNLKSGWVIIKKDENSNKIIIKSHPSTPFPEKPKPEKSNIEIGKNILRALSDLHERRTKEYIDNYGEYTWEKMFKRPRWSEEEAENISYSDGSDSDDYDNYEDEDE
jgi:hypothetical protein